MSDIEFVDGPPKVSRTERSPAATEITAKLQAQPGSWAIVARSAVRNDLTSLHQTLKKRGCQVTCRKLNAKTVALYARWPEDAS